MGSSSADLVLNTGASMPLVGLGTWKSTPEEVGGAVAYALKECGYRHIDCASIYGNEKEIGGSLRTIFGDGALKREEVFITSKLWNNAHRKGAVRKACESTLRDLKLDYLDLYLMHWGLASSPEKDEAMDAEGNLIVDRVPIRETWGAMEDLVRAGLVKAIGVSNFAAPMLLDLCSYASIQPAMNQIELHAYFQQTRLLGFCQRIGIAVTAYSPLGRPGDSEMAGRLVEDETILRIARAHNKTPAQVLLRWGTQRNTVVIPKSTHQKRIKENINIFDLELSTSEMEAIAGLERGQRLVDPYVWGKIPYFD